MKEIKNGWHQMRKFPNLGLPVLRWVWVHRVLELGDGTKIVQYTFNYPFPVTEEMEVGEFIKNIVVQSKLKT